MFVVTSCNMQGVTSDITETVPEAADRTKGVYITLEGGSGRAHIDSPVKIETRDGQMYATLVWSSKNYDYVLVDGVKYENENPGGNSTFTVPVGSLDEPFSFIGDTVAMSTPHEIEYTIIWNADGDKGESENEYEKGEDPSRGFGSRPEGYKEPDLPGLSRTGGVTLSYANSFAINEYGDYRLISIYGVGEYLLVPEDKEIPEGIPEDITVLKKPLDNTYLVSASVMDMLRAVGALDSVALSGKRADDWYIEEAAELMNEGAVKYAGKYRTPDYELIVSEGCDLAIENTMIYHDPQVKEKLEELGIPVLVETSSYETQPLGRLEWIKLYGVLFDREEEADELFDKEAGRMEKAAYESGSKKSVAVFYVSATGLINVRNPHDYIAKMIEMSGGRYIPDGADLSEISSATVNMQAEDFYVAAKDADILIYNSTIDKELKTVDELIAKNAMFADMKAVKDKEVYCLKPDFFQRTTSMADFITDMHTIISDGGGEYRFFERLK